MIQFEDLELNLVVQEGKAVLRITRVYPEFCIARLLMTAKGTKPVRDSVRYYTKSSMGRLTPCSEEMYNKAMEVY